MRRFVGASAVLPGMITYCVALVSLLSGALAREQIHLVFSNHLDVGFDGINPTLGTDYNVINKYFTEYFAKASWLVSLYLDCPAGMDLQCPEPEHVKAFEEAVREGSIYWHALPFNGQLEFFDRSLLEFAVQLTHELDAKFGLPPKKTMSQRDVPGFTRAALPILAGQGVKAVTVGVNGGSAPPAVPHNTPFLWRDTLTQTDMLAMWHPGGYSGQPVDSKEECVSVPGLQHRLCMAWRQDNAGPHSPEEVMDIFDRTKTAFPDSDVFASTLDAFTDALLAALPQLDLPVVTQEIGDTWAYGIGSDADKVAEYRALLRMRTATEWKIEEAAYRNFSRLLLKIPEHTWGFDTKTFLHDNANWSNAQFHAELEAHAGNYEANIAQWQRQRGYLSWALEALDMVAPHEDLQEAGSQSHLRLSQNLELTEQLEEVRSELRRQHELPSLEGYQEHPLGDPLKLRSPNWELELNTDTGAIIGLQYLWPEQAGANWATPEKPLGQVLYETFTEEDYHVIWETYSYSDFSWDFGKLNSSEAKPRHSQLKPEVFKIYKQQEEHAFKVLMKGSMPEWAVAEAGAPSEVWLDIQAPEDSDSLYLDVVWVNKTATRLPEAMWVQFAPSSHVADPESWQMYKLGQPISPLDVVYNGSRSLHAVSDEGISVRGVGKASWEQLNIRSLDAALVSPGQPTAFPTTRTQPDLTTGMAFNLANNLWGTNYVMWQPYEEEQKHMRFRFLLQMTQ